MLKMVDYILGQELYVVYSPLHDVKLLSTKIPQEIVEDQDAPEYTNEKRLLLFHLFTVTIHKYKSINLYKSWSYIMKNIANSYIHVSSMQISIGRSYILPFIHVQNHRNKRAVNRSFLYRYNFRNTLARNRHW